MTETKKAESVVQSAPILIPLDRLSVEALSQLIEAFVLREGTDYGSDEVPHQTKLRQVRSQVENHEVKIVYDPDSESVTLMNSVIWKKMNQEN